MIQFILNNQTIKTSVNSGITLLDFIREYQQLKGTKIGCREGDCGACTVLVGELINDNVIYQSITSCISPLGNANGKHIVTVEGINLPIELNVVQQFMADNFATQCGFCTPGFVVSMTGFALTNDKIINTCNDAISGNICRCTGYKSIEKAGFEIEEKLKQKDDNRQVEWLIKEGFIPDYFKTIPEKLKELVIARREEQTIQQSHHNSTLEISPKTKSRGQNKTIVANGTDLYVRYADKLSEEKVHLISDDKTLKGISFADDICSIGANTTVTELLANKELRKQFPKLPAFLKLISSEQIRNMGTLGGNFVNASPIGDLSIFFLALNSVLTIQDENGRTRQIPFQKFHQNYKQYDLQKGELIQSISFTKLKENEFFNFEKVSKRTHLDIASVNTAGRITVQNRHITNAHFSLGGVAAIPKYLEKTNQFLVGKALNSATIKEAELLLQLEILPINDVRGSNIYKRLLAKQLFFTHFITLFPNKINLNELVY